MAEGGVRGTGRARQGMSEEGEGVEERCNVTEIRSMRACG